jgi:DNA replication and repair protein RecF
MGFKSVRFFNFRNLKDRELALGAREVFLIGENGQGKTNLIEALYLLCVASSFRESRDAPLMRDPGLEMGLFGRYGDGEASGKTLSLQISPEKKREIRVDGKPVSERKDLLGQVLCICMVQQDMDFVAGPPEAKRRFFDQTLLLCDPPFFRTIRDYRRVLRSRNFVLKSKQTGLLEAYDRQLSSLGWRKSSMRSSPRFSRM